MTINGTIYPLSVSQSAHLGQKQKFSEVFAKATWIWANFYFICIVFAGRWYTGVYMSLPFPYFSFNLFILLRLLFIKINPWFYFGLVGGKKGIHWFCPTLITCSIKLWHPFLRTILHCITLLAPKWDGRFIIILFGQICICNVEIDTLKVNGNDIWRQVYKLDLGLVLLSEW